MTLLGQNVNSYGRDLPAESRTGFAELLARVDAVEGIERIRYTSPHPKDMKEDVIRAHAELPALCEHIHLPLQSGSSAGAQTDAAHLRPRPLHGPCRADSRARARLRDHHRHHRRLPGRDRGRLRSRRSRSSTRSATTAPSPSSSRRGAKPRRRRWTGRSRTRSSGSGWNGWSSWSSGARPSGRSGSSGARWRCSSKGPSRTDRTGCAGGRGTTRRSIRRGRRARRARRRCEIDRAATSHDSRSGVSARQPPIAAPVNVDRDIRADRGRQDRRRDRACRAAAERGEDPVAISCDALQVYEGLGALTGAATAEEQARLEHRLVGFVPVTQPFSVGDYMRARARRGRCGAGGGRQADRRRRDRALPAGGDRRAVAGQGAARSRGLRALVAGDAPPDDDLRPRHGPRRSSTSGSTPAPRRSSPPAPPRRRAAPRRSGPRERPARRSASTSCSAGDIEAMKKRSRNYARRQLTWMRKIPEPAPRSTAPAAATRRSPGRSPPCSAQ